MLRSPSASPPASLADVSGERFPESLAEVLNVSEETNDPLAQALKSIAERENASMLAFINSYVGVRISPADTLIPAISLLEEFGIEYALSRVLERAGNSKRLYLLVNSPGGTPASSYVVARALRAHFEHIKVFVPHIAASGATLITLAGNEIVMGMMGRLGPIDVQLAYERSSVSSYTMSRALSRLEDYFKDKTPDEAPYPRRVMAEKLDPILLEDFNSHLTEVAGYALEILQMSGYNEEERIRIVSELVYTNKTHGFVIHKDRAKALNLKVVDEPQDLRDLDVMREWLSAHMFSREATHAIRYIPAPERKGKGGKARAKKAI